jgi:predicted MPP superfamily phosphohydrolase
MVQPGFLKAEVAPEKIAASLKDLQAPLGVYAVLGNHDWWFNGKHVRKAFDDAGIRVIDNHALPIEKEGNRFWLVGLGDAWTGRPAVNETFAMVPAGAPTIALTHNPDLFLQLPDRDLLLLAAHTHGGQVNLPFVGRLVVPSKYGQRFAAGLVREDSKTLFVTTGIGTSIFPVRFRVPPEIVILTIRPD